MGVGVGWDVEGVVVRMVGGYGVGKVLLVG